MSHLLDTCVISEHSQKRPDPQVLAWIYSIAEDRLYLSALSVGEVRQGAAHVAGTAKSARILDWIEGELMPRFEQRILPVDIQVAMHWGELRGALMRRGRPPSLLDSLIATTAIVHGLTLVTRNVDDFRDFDVPILNPWNP